MRPPQSLENKSWLVRLCGEFSIVGLGLMPRLAVALAIVAAVWAMVLGVTLN